MCVRSGHSPYRRAFVRSTLLHINAHQCIHTHVCKFVRTVKWALSALRPLLCLPSICFHFALLWPLLYYRCSLAFSAFPSFHFAFAFAASSSLEHSLTGVVVVARSVRMRVRNKLACSLTLCGWLVVRSLVGRQVGEVEYSDLESAISEWHSHYIMGGWLVVVLLVLDCPRLSANHLFSTNFAATAAAMLRLAFWSSTHNFVLHSIVLFNLFGPRLNYINNSLDLFCLMLL